MPDVKQFKLPDLGEGLTEGEILEWRVAVGDTVEVNDTIAEVETVKAAVELPTPFAGVVTELHAAAGETVPVGSPIISIDTVPGGEPAQAPSAAQPASAPKPPTDGDDSGDAQMTLVGYGPQAEAGARRRRKSGGASPSMQTAFNMPPPPPTGTHRAEPDAEQPDEPEQPTPGDNRRARAKPPVRKLAKSLGVDLSDVEATGPNGTISREDVQAASTPVSEGTPSRHSALLSGGERSSSAERETRIPIKGVRKHTAAAMVASAFTAPHVTEFVTVDVTATMELRDRVIARREFQGVKVSPLLFLAKAVVLATRGTPEINARWDEAAGEIVLEHYVNLGIAAATERGLIVPNIKDADQLSLLELAHAIAALTETARAGRTSPADMTGGTITITNVGMFGIDTGTPILNPGEAGIVAFGAVRRMPWVVEEEIVPRWVTQLAVSFDHRLVDGQQGSRFLADVAAVLGDPGMALL